MHVLIVDDEQKMRELVSRGGWRPMAMKSFRHTTPTARSPSSSSNRLPDVAVIFATADDAVPARISLQEGVLGYLVKPFRADQVRGAVNDAMAWHQAAARSPQRQSRDADRLDAFLRPGRPPGTQGQFLNLLH
jgi:DNA-binding NtrC family response regulator